MLTMLPAVESPGVVLVDSFDGSGGETSGCYGKRSTVKRNCCGG